jgi:hypothetical protein
MSNKVDFGNWHSKIGTSAENSPNREAPNKHAMGRKKYKEMIAKDTKRIDEQGKMPFSFSKPAKTTRYREDIYHVCDKCHHISFVSKHRAGQVCGGCKGYTSVNSSNTFNTEEELDLALQELGPADD